MWIEQEIHKLIDWKSKLGKYIYDVRKYLEGKIDKLDDRIDRVLEKIENIEDEVLTSSIQHINDSIIDVRTYLDSKLSSFESDIFEMYKDIRNIDSKFDTFLDEQKDKIFDIIADRVDELIEKYLESEVK